MKDILHILILLQLLDQFLNRLTLLRSHLLQIIGDADKLATGDFIAIILQILLDSWVLRKLTIDNNLILVLINLIYTIVDQLQLQVVQWHIGLLSDMENAFVLKQEFQATCRT